VCEAIIEKCCEFYLEVDRRTFEDNPGKIDMYFMGNDFGSQRALLMSPDMWRKFYKPYVAKLIAQAKRNGCVTAIHSCGDIHEIIGDFIEIGVDAINPIQIGAEHMRPEDLIKEFGADCVFFGGIDENNILQYATEEEVRAETRRIIDVLGKHGRYIVAASHDYLLPEIPAKSIVAMFDEAKKYGQYATRREPI
jgi:uroporphyrinogen decarboxylase